MSEVIEQALFRNMYEALDFGYSMKYASPYPSQSFERIERFNAWTDLTPQERFGQAAYIVDIAESNIKIPEVALIRLRHGHGEDKVNGVIGISEHVTPYRDWETDRKSTRLNSSHSAKSRMPSSA